MSFFYTLILIACITINALVLSPESVQARDQGKQLVEKKCSNCHRFEGKPKSRFDLKAPDLMWGGNKFQRPWLMDFLIGKEKNLYQRGYRWDQSQKQIKHVRVNKKDAELIADFFEKSLKDSRVKSNALDLDYFTQMEATLGEKIFNDHSCIACHQIEIDGKPQGGSQSVSFFNAGKRLNVDWVYRFNLEPPDFTPHSGEFVADVSELGLRYVTGYIMTLGVENFNYYEPWNEKAFKEGSAKRGGLLYKEYCAQCHGLSGKGDGPAALDLNPRPAVHSEMAIDKEPIDYLFNVIYYGGKKVGKSALMPYWGLTLGQEGVADVIAYMKKEFKGKNSSGTSGIGDQNSSTVLGECPQKRTTTEAPEKFRGLKNPLEPTEKAIKKGKSYFLNRAKPLACKHCHGIKGDGKGYKAVNMIPPPRNFTCSTTMNELTDGQMFWVIKNGSKGTDMPAYSNMKDKQIWQMVLYIRQLVN